MESSGRSKRCGQNHPGTLAHLCRVIPGCFFLSRHRKKSSVTDSFNNLVHRHTVDQFTEGVAPRMSSQPCRPQAALFQTQGGVGWGTHSPSHH